MPFDGIVTKCMVNELNKFLTGGRIDKISQPEPDEIILNIRSLGKNYKLLLCSNAMYPRAQLTETQKDNPLVPLNFCMSLRKHISGGRITEIIFHDYERIITFVIDTMSELGDNTSKKLIIEIMGKHSNIILTNAGNKILDAIKHVDSQINKIREILPARPYVAPPSQDKQNPEKLEPEQFFTIENIKTLIDENETEISVEKFIVNNILGFSPQVSREICEKADIPTKKNILSLEKHELDSLCKNYINFINDLQNNKFEPCIALGMTDTKKYTDFHAILLKSFEKYKKTDTMSQALDIFYSEKDLHERLKSRKGSIYKELKNASDRAEKKINILNQTISEASEKDKYKLWGELINANIYQIEPGQSKALVENYYSQDLELIEIKLDEKLSPQKNAQKYFKQYNKQKSAHENAQVQLVQANKDFNYMQSALYLLEEAVTFNDIEEIKTELLSQGIVKDRKKSKPRQKQILSKPHKFIASDGSEIFVGKNNFQNDQLTLKTASSMDLWFHAKNIPGSHVIIKKHQKEVSDDIILQAATLAALHSKGKTAGKVPVDYTLVKNVKKPSGSRPGMVIYDNYTTVYVNPNDDIINKLQTI